MHVSLTIIFLMTWILLIYLFSLMIFAFWFKSIKARNELSAFVYKLIETSPGLIGFSIVEILRTSTTENNEILVYVLVLGFFMIAFGRQINKFIYFASKERKKDTHNKKSFLDAYKEK